MLLKPLNEQYVKLIQSAAVATHGPDAPKYNLVSFSRFCEVLDLCSIFKCSPAALYDPGAVQHFGTAVKAITDGFSLSEYKSMRSLLDLAAPRDVNADGEGDWDAAAPKRRLRELERIFSETMVKVQQAPCGCPVPLLTCCVARARRFSMSRERMLQSTTTCTAFGRRPSCGSCS